MMVSKTILLGRYKTEKIILEQLSIKNKGIFMSFKADTNSILRSNNYLELTLGKIYTFENQGSIMLFDKSSIWLTKNDWTVQAEITIISQSIENKKLKGTFRIDYIYKEAEQHSITHMFIRMYGGQNDPFIYLLSSKKEYNQAISEGQLSRDSIAEEGFIHASPKSQLTRIANKYYKETISLLILVVEKSKITAEVKWEPATGGLYPHIYGTLNTDAIVEVQNITLNKEGKYRL